MDWLSREERTAYEKKRRDKVMQQSRDYRVMSGWLMTLYPDIMTAFMVFKSNLGKENPSKKDLSTSSMFKRFLRKKNRSYLESFRRAEKNGCRFERHTKRLCTSSYQDR